jgi:hypothetical protein
MNKPTESAVIRAKEWWNSVADQWNQWDALGQDEKDGLIEKMRKNEQQTEG